MSCITSQKNEDVIYRVRKPYFVQLIRHFLVSIHLLSFILYQITKTSAAFGAMLIKKVQSEGHSKLKVIGQFMMRLQYHLYRHEFSTHVISCKLSCKWCEEKYNLRTCVAPLMSSPCSTIIKQNTHNFTQLCI